MATAGMIENNVLNPQIIRRFYGAPPHYDNFSEEKKLNILGIGVNNKKVATLGDLQSAIILKYRFPPTDCNNAMLTLSQINNDLQEQQQRIAGGGASKSQINWGTLIGPAAVIGLVTLLTTGKTSGKDIDNTIINAMEQTQKNFQDWIDQEQCVVQTQNQQNTATTTAILSALNSPQAQGQTVATQSSNWIIYAAMGLLLVGGLIVILKK